MIQSVERAINILDVIHKNPDGHVGLVEIARSLNLEKSTVFNLVKTLKAKGYVVQEKQGDKYSLGSELIRLTWGKLSTSMLNEKLLPFCAEIREKTNESALIVTYFNADLKIICRLISEKDVKVIPNANKPLYATASGRCLLATLPESEVEEIVDIHGFPGDAWNGIRDKAVLKKELEQIKEKKIITVVSQEREVAAIGAIIDVPEKHAPLAMGLFLPLYRFSAERRDGLVKLIEDYSHRISLYLSKQNQSCSISDNIYIADKEQMD